MPDTLRKVEYFTIFVSHKPAEAFRVLSTLNASAGLCETNIVKYSTLRSVSGMQPPDQEPIG